MGISSQGSPTTVLECPPPHACVGMMMMMMMIKDNNNNYYYYYNTTAASFLKQPYVSVMNMEYLHLFYRY